MIVVVCVVGMVDVGMLKVNVVVCGNQCVMWQVVFDQFYKVNFDVDLKVSYVGEEVYKVQMFGWFVIDLFDVLSWNNGEWFVYFVKCGLIEDLGVDWQKNGWNDMYVFVKQLLMYGGKVYSLLFGYDVYGLFYCKDLFEKVGIYGELVDWLQFFDVCCKLKVVGIVLIVVVVCDVWMFVVWFDYFDLWINGYVFYQKLMVGDVVYIDLCVCVVYVVWKKLIDDKYFIDNVLFYDVDLLSLLIVNGQVVMMLMGIWYLVGLLSVVCNLIGFFCFLVIDVLVLFVEDGLVNVLIVFVKVYNKVDVWCFFVFMGQLVVNGEFVKGMG